MASKKDEIRIDFDFLKKKLSDRLMPGIILPIAKPKL